MIKKIKYILGIFCFITLLTFKSFSQTNFTDVGSILFSDGSLISASNGTLSVSNLNITGTLGVSSISFSSLYGGTATLWNIVATSNISTPIANINELLVGGILLSNLSPNTVLVSDGSGDVTNAITTLTQINYLDTLTNNVQSQLNLLAPLSNPMFVGTISSKNICTTNTDNIHPLYLSSGSNWTNTTGYNIMVYISGVSITASNVKLNGNVIYTFGSGTLYPCGFSMKNGDYFCLNFTSLGPQPNIVYIAQ